MRKKSNYCHIKFYFYILFFVIFPLARTCYAGEISEKIIDEGVLKVRPGEKIWPDANKTKIVDINGREVIEYGFLLVFETAGSFPNPFIQTIYCEWTYDGNKTKRTRYTLPPTNRLAGHELTVKFFEEEHLELEMTVLSFERHPGRLPYYKSLTVRLVTRQK